MKNPRFVNEVGGILMDYDDDGLPSLYIDTGELYSRAIAGEFGSVAPYIPPPEPTYAERLAAARASATLTRREFFLGLDAMGIYDAVMTADMPRAARIELETATHFDRTRPTLVEMAHSLGVTDEQLDALFNVEVTP